MVDNEVIAFTDEIVSIEELELETSIMYDIGMVDTPHTFFANNILVHNSIFYNALPILKSRNVEYTEETLPKMCVEVSSEMQEYVNKSYDLYAENFHGVKEHKWKIKKELVAKRAFWSNVKKRYAMWLVMDGDREVDRFEIKGFDSVRSDYPKVFRKVIEETIHGILKDVSKIELIDNVIGVKENLMNADIYSIMNPTSVNNLEDWTPSDENSIKKGTPVHVKSAIYYNRLLNKFGSDNIAPIYGGDKIMWVYLKQNPYGYSSIALKGYDDDPKVVDFVKKYVDLDKVFDKAIVDKLQSIWDSLNFGDIMLNKNIMKIYKL